MKYELPGVAKSLLDVPPGEAFSTVFPNGRSARFVKIVSPDGAYVGCVSIGPYLEDDRPAQFYSADILAEDELVLHEAALMLRPVPGPNPIPVVRPLDLAPGSVAIAMDRIFLRIGCLKDQQFVGLDDGKLATGPGRMIASFRYYRLEGPDRAGTVRTLFDSSRPEWG